VIQKKTAVLLTILSLLLLGVIIPWQKSASGANVVVNSGGWETPLHLSTTSTNGAFIPVLQAAPDGSLMVMYNHQVSSGVHNPYYRRLPAGSDNWSNPAPVRTSTDNLRQATFAFDNNSMGHAVWRTVEEEIQYAVQTVQSQWPNQAETIVNAATSVLDPDIVVDSNNLPHVVWAEGLSSSRQIYHAYRTGGSWEITSLSTTQRQSGTSSVAVDADRNAHVVWEDRFVVSVIPEPTYRYEIHYKKGTWTGSGYTWDSNPTILSTGIDTARRPTIVNDGNMLHVAFTRRDSSTEQYAYYTRFTPGSGWSTPVDTTNGSPVGVNTNSPFFLTNSVSTCNNTVALHFHGTLSATGSESIWGTRSNNNQGWSGQARVTTDGVRAINPSTICVGGTVHLVYEVVVQINDNHQIYYTKQKNLLYLPIIRR
jgi:hypothetical protein